MTRKLSAAIILALATLAFFLPASAQAQSYRDVPRSYWAYSAIAWATNQGPVGAKLLNDYPGKVFKPSQAITRQQFAAALVTAMGLQSDSYRQSCRAGRPALDEPLLPRRAGGDRPALLRHLKRHVLPRRRCHRVAGRSHSGAHDLPATPGADWRMLRALRPTVWRPNTGWTTGAPSCLPWEVAARFLGLRYNHLSAPALEVSADQDIDRAEAAYMFKAALTLPPWQLAELSWFDKITLPSLSARQRQIIAFALQYVGYPYVWGGTYPTPDSPYGLQAHGGFDCSGFVWWVLKMNFGDAIPDSPAHRGPDGGPRQAPHHPGQARSLRHHLLRTQRPKIERRLGLSHRHLPGKRLVCRVVEHLRRGHPGQPRLAGLVLPA